MKTLQQVLLTFKAWGLAAYDFDNAEYHGALKPITGILCKEHGVFQQYAGQFQKDGGAGCPACGSIKRGLARRVSSAQMLENIQAIHSTRYTFPNLLAVDKPGTTTKIDVVCELHGPFESHYSNLLNGKGCPVCAVSTRGRYTGTYAEPPQAAVARVRIARKLETLEAEFRAVHGDKYSYELMDYRGMRKPIAIVCKDHGPFEQVPYKHLQCAQGCPKCSHRISKQEVEITDFLRSLGLSVEIQDKTILAPAELDIWIPEKNTAVEFNGAYWHADDRERKNTCTTKHKACAEKGIRLISIFDFEWQNSRHAVEATLQAVAGKQQKVGARAVVLAELTPAVAREFLNKWHVAKFVNAQLYLGAYVGEELAGVATFGKSRFEQDAYELLRYATNCHLVGGLPKFVKRAQGILGFFKLVSYCDLRYGTGTSYAAAGFEYDSTTPPDYWWFKGDKRYTRYAVQKHKLAENPDFAGFFSKDKTERQIMEEAGFRKISGAGHSKWIFLANK